MGLAKSFLSRYCENMPAKNYLRVAEEGTYSHIYNRGIEKRIIFNEREDYEVFLRYLKDYLTAPGDLESAKKDFTVNGRVFRGVPHQPKNYFNKVELIGYSLMPNHFHLLLHQKTRDSLESFIRSLCTRYSMYFNKKYKRNGTLFQGPYKSVHIKDVPQLLLLTRYFHHTGDYSSYSEYLGLRETSWVKPEVVMSFFSKTKNDSFGGADGDEGSAAYKNFVEKYELEQKEEEALEGIILESASEHLEGRVPELARSESSEEKYVEPSVKQLPTIPEFVAITAVFLLLFTFGIGNIRASATKSSSPSPTPLVSGVSSTSSSKVEKVKPKITVVVKINDGSPSVNIRQKPMVQSEKIGEAKDGETFEFISVNSGWYEVKLASGSGGFILAAYAETQEGANN